MACRNLSAIASAKLQGMSKDFWRARFDCCEADPALSMRLCHRVIARQADHAERPEQRPAGIAGQMGAHAQDDVSLILRFDQD